MNRETNYRGARERHGDSNTPLYDKWASMHSRVSPKWKHREHYFDRGIVVCDEWGSYTAFKVWALANGYAPHLELDRRDNDKGYGPNNCRFVTRLYNNSNRSNTVYVVYRGERQSLTLLCLELEFSSARYHATRRRIKDGWDHSEAINTPVMAGNYKAGQTVEIIDIAAGITYPSLKEAAKAFDIRPNRLSEYLSGRRVNRTSLRLKSA